MKFSFCWKHAGLITMWSDAKEFTLHLFPSRNFWYWGKSICEHTYSAIFGLGPLFLISYEK